MEVVTTPKICSEREKKGKGGKKERREEDNRERRKRTKRRKEQEGKMYYGCQMTPWNCQKIIKDT